MSTAARTVRRHPLWLTPLIAVLAVGAFLTNGVQNIQGEHN